MNINDSANNKFKWGDSVKIINQAPHEYHPGKCGEICTVGKILYPEVAKEYHSVIGSWMYTVEFANGSDLIIAEEYLEKDEDNNSNTPQ